MSHTYENLSTSTATKKAKNCAKNIPLVHCIREHTPLLGIIEFLRTGNFNNVISRDSTRTASYKLGIPPNSMFFYAGRAFPELNIQVVLLYGGIFDSDNKDESNIENIIQENNSDLMDCGVRPFDSGGLVTKKLKLNLSSCIKKVEGVSQVKSYFDEHNLSELLEWRRYFALFLTSFFKSPQDYWDGFPNKKIDGTSFKKNDCWRNWTFEIHSNWHVSPKFAGVIMIDERLERHARNQAGFGGKPIMAPIVRRIAQFHYSPREKAEHDMRIICLNNNKNET